MKGKSALMAGVAIVALTAMGQAGFAGNTAATAAAAGTDQSGPTTAELLERVEALESELQDSEVRNAADHDKVDAWKPMTGWWDSTSISGRMYYDITNISQKSNKVESTSNGTSFDIKRFYLGVDHKFDDTFSANLTTDFTYDSTAGATQLYLKKAYLQAKLDDAFIVRVGSADMAWIPYAEGVAGYRYVENPLIDRVKFGNSADWGIHMLGKFGGGLFSYQVSVVSGAGYKKTVRTEDPDIEGRLSFEYEGLSLAVGGYTGKLGVQHGTRDYHTAQRFNAIAAYKIDGLNVGIEYFTASNYTQVTSTTSTHANGYSPFVSYQFDPQWSVFGRYDHVTPYNDPTRKDFENNYFNVGISYTPAKIVDIALVYKYDEGKNGYLKDSNGTIGGSAFAKGNNGAYNEIGIWGQLRW